MEISTSSDGLAESGIVSIVRNRGGTEDRLRNASETFIYISLIVVLNQIHLVATECQLAWAHRELIALFCAATASQLPGFAAAKLQQANEPARLGGLVHASFRPQDRDS